MAPAAVERVETERIMRKCRHWEIKNIVIMNPVVFISSLTILWGLVIACIVDPDHMLRGMKGIALNWIPEVWTWFYIVSQDIWVAVLFFILISSKYGNIKMGKDTDEPEYTFATWFSMLFSAGVAIGLFYYSVAEPVWNYKGRGSPHFISGSKEYGNANEDSTMAMAVTWYHRGPHGWIPYTTMGAVLGLMSYRRGFPMSIRYCLFPIIGDKCFGVLGDLVDIMSIVTTIAGVCTSLGLGAMQVNQGMQRLNHGFYRGVNYAIPHEAKYSTPTCGGAGQICAPGQEAYGLQVNVPTQIMIIFVITIIATLSVVSGMNRGIVNLSRFNFALGTALLFVILFLGETYFILDVFVQTLGYYMWYILKLAFHCDAWERLGKKSMGLGGAPDDIGGDSSWLGSWTIFYWGWWIAWGPFVGTFLAKISRGRTLRQFILGTLIIPSLYSFFWFTVWGAEGIRMQRMADGSQLCQLAQTANCTLPVEGKLSENCASYSGAFTEAYKKERGIGWTPTCVLDPTYHRGFGKCNEVAWTRLQAAGQVCVETTTWVNEPCGTEPDPTALTSIPRTGPCAGKITAEHVNGPMDRRKYNLFESTVKPRAPCFIPAQGSIICLWNQGTTDILFDQLQSYGPRGFTDFLSVIALLALLLYFITSSDSGSLVTDMLSANGHPDPPIPQRIFWSFTEGATAAALLYSGRNAQNSDQSLKALQSASIAAGLPYTFILFWCAQSLYLLVREESGELDANRKAFCTFIVSFTDPIKLVLNTLVPGISLGRIIKKVGGYPFYDLGPRCAGAVWTVFFQFEYMLAIIFTLLGTVLYQWIIVGLSAFLGFGFFVGFLRSWVRSKYMIQHGDLITDCLVGIFLPMFAITQMQVHVENDELIDVLGNRSKMMEHEVEI